MDLPFLILLFALHFSHWTTATLFTPKNSRQEVDHGLLKKVIPLTETRSIALTGLNIKSIAKNAFDNLTNMKSLDLSRNSIEKLEDSVFQNLRNLEELSLADNKLKSSDFDKSTSIFAGLGHLKHLNLSGNDMSELSSNSFVGLPNSAEVIIDPFSLYTYPRTFYFRERSTIEKKEAKIRNLSISPRTKRSTYRMKLCVIDGIVESLSKLKFDEILDSNCSEVSEFRRRQNTINLRKRHLKSFNRNWYRLPDAKNIDLTGNLITELAPVLNDLPLPIRIQLSFNKIRIIRKNMIKNEQCMILWLGGKILEAIEDDAFKDLCLTTLKITGSSLWNLDFVRTLPVTIQNLKLYQNKFTEIPSNSFRNLQKLRLIDLEDNRITTIRENAFSGLGRSGPVRIFLLYNKIDFIGVGSFSQMNIDYLDLAMNEVTSDSIRKGAFNESIVRQINLSRNKIESFDEELFDGIEGNCLINYEFNPITSIKNLNYRSKKI